MKDVVRKRPCSNCPFLRKNGIRLMDVRYDEIVTTDSEFRCHKTTKETGNGTEKVCAGWVGFLLKNPEYGGQMFRILGRLGMINENVDYLDKIFDDLNEMKEYTI